MTDHVKGHIPVLRGRIPCVAHIQTRILTIQQKRGCLKLQQCWEVTLYNAIPTAASAKDQMKQLLAYALCFTNSTTSARRFSIHRTRIIC